MYYDYTMKTMSVQQPINLKVVRFQLDFTPFDEPKRSKRKKIRVPKVYHQPRSIFVPAPPQINNKKRDVKDLVEQLLEELYSDQRDWVGSNCTECRGSVSVSSYTSSSHCKEKSDAIERSYLDGLELSELRSQVAEWQSRLEEEGNLLARCARARDRQRRKQKKFCAAFSVLLRHLTGDSSVRFSVTPGGDNLGPGEGGYAEWLHAMRLVARLPAGVPQHFRKKLWLTLSERYLKTKGVDWALAERACFRGTAQPDDTELGAQILKDLHRTGCSLFCGTEGRENQAMLRRVLLAYARWNKDVGYCQGFNMLAAIILEVMEKSEPDSLKVMIYIVEAVLPEGYFADDLRGLSADMAAFRDLLRLRLPRLAQHMDRLQKLSDGGGVEPPLPDVFTMQWFLTLYATWLPRESLLRIWDLIMLDGNEILLLTALAIWDMLQDRILSARSADEYYSSMGGGAGAIWDAGEALVAKVVALGSAPELPRLRNIHRYRVAPPVIAPTQPPFQSAMHSMTKRGLRLFYSEDEGDSSDDGNKMALTTVIPRRDERLVANDRLSLDIGALKRQYARLRERQRQAHVILAAACARHAAVGVSTSPTSLTVNNLLLGKSAIVSTRGRRLGPPPGAIPPSRKKSNETQNQQTDEDQSDTISWNDEHSRKSLSRRNSVKWKDIKKEQEIERARKTSIDFDETGDGIIVSEREANEMMASLRNRSTDESSSYSSHSESSSNTSLCDQHEKDSDSEPDLPNDAENKPNKMTRSHITSKSSPDIADDVLKEERATSSATDIASFIKSSAGEPLRDYIGAFEYKLKESNTLRPTTNNDILTSESSSKNNQTISPISPSNFTELSPIHSDGSEKIPYKYNFEKNFKRPQNIDLDANFRPPDIIDSFTKYPNFVPDLDLSENNILGLGSPQRSPGSDSVVISEDEPPIPLNIDKYFEDSPEFFGARITVTDSNITDIKSRRPSRRQLRIPKKTDSLNIQRSSNDESLAIDTEERASSLPQSHSFSEKIQNTYDIIKKKSFEDPIYVNETAGNNQLSKPAALSPKELIISGRKNSEKALQIIQENSKILNRILTKQSFSSESNKILETGPTTCALDYMRLISKDETNKNSIETPLALKESSSDSLIRCSKSYCERKNEDKILSHKSLDDPVNKEKIDFKYDFKSPSLDTNVNNTDLYGWENKGFLARSDHVLAEGNNYTNDRSQIDNICADSHHKLQLSESRTLLSKQSFEAKDRHESFSSESNNFPYLNKYSEFYVSRDIYNSTTGQGPTISSDQNKIEDSQVSDFAHNVTSSISFTYDRSADDESPTAKSNSSDTLCQITSLDQVSTPISPKIFPRDTPTNLPREYLDKSDKTKDSDDTCSAITSLLDSDTISSLSCPRSPSTGSFYPFPTRPSLKMPKELGVRLGMYAKDKIDSPTK